MTDTITINGVTYGAPIPHYPTPVTLSDGTVVQPVCPWPDVVGFFYMENSEGEVWAFRNLKWGLIPTCPEAQITSYRLPLSHHAYGDRKSGRGEPDAWVNDYPIGGVGCEYGSREEASRWCLDNRIGIWRIYMKGEVK